MIKQGTGSEDAENRGGVRSSEQPQGAEKRGWWQRRAENTMRQNAEQKEKSREWGVSMAPRGDQTEIAERAQIKREFAAETDLDARNRTPPSGQTRDDADKKKLREWGVSMAPRGPQTERTEYWPSAEIEPDEGVRALPDEQTLKDAVRTWRQQRHGTRGANSPEEPVGEFAEVESGDTVHPRRHRWTDIDRREATGNDARGGSDRLWNLIALTLFLALPLMFTSRIAVERAGSRSESVQEIGSIWGGPQVITGPFLVIPIALAPSAGVKAQDSAVQIAPLVLLPETLKIGTELNADVRKQGIFRVPVYQGRHEISLSINTDYAEGLLAEGEMLRWEDTIIALGISEPQKIRSDVVLAGGAHPIEFQPGSGVDRISGVHARIGDPRDHVGDWSFILEMDGSQQFRLSPAGRLTELRLHSDWPHPEFAGAFPPAFTELGSNGFAAEWQIPQLAVPQAFRGTDRVSELEGAAFGVNFGQRHDLYRITQRAAKLGLGLIALTFGAIFLIGRAARQPAHIGQYALVGMVQAVSFVLMLSVAEQIGFRAAYVVAVAATIALLTGYAWFALRLGPRSGWLTAVLTTLYGMMYPIMLANEQALLTGSALAFLIVGGVMFSVRSEDWDAVARALRRPPRRGPEPQPAGS